MKRAATTDRQDADQVCYGPSGEKNETRAGISRTDRSDRVRTLTGKEIELDIEADYKVRNPPTDLRRRETIPMLKCWHEKVHNRL